MVKTAVAESWLDERVQALLRSGTFEQGLIIGQSVEQRNTIVSLIPAPPLQLAQDGSGAPRPAPNSAQSFITSLDASWILTHAHSVVRMLPGGLSILGIYTFCSSDVALAKTSFPTYRKILASLADVLPGSKEPLMLNICSQSKKLTLRSFNLADREFEASVVEFKQVSQSIPFVLISSQLDISLSIPVGDGSGSLANSIDRAVTSECRRFSSLVACFENGDIIDNTRDDTVKDLLETGSKDLRIRLLSPSGIVRGSLSKQTVTAHTQITLAGTITVFAYVAAKENVSVALDFLRADAATSLLARVSLLLDDLREEPEGKELQALNAPSRPLSLVLPRRHRLNKSPFYVDYIFPDEDQKDVLDRWSMLLHFQLSSVVDLVSSEAFPSVSTPVVIAAPSQPNKPAQQQISPSLSPPVSTHQKFSSILNVWLIVAAIIVLIIAIWVIPRA